MARGGQRIRGPGWTCQFPADSVGATPPPGGRIGERPLWPVGAEPQGSLRFCQRWALGYIHQAFPKVVTLSFLLGSWATILRTGLVSAWGSAAGLCSRLLHLPITNLSWDGHHASLPPRPQALPHHPMLLTISQDTSPEVEGINLSSLWRARSSPGEPTPQNQLQGLGIPRGSLGAESPG